MRCGPTASRHQLGFVLLFCVFGPRFLGSCFLFTQASRLSVGSWFRLHRHLNALFRDHMAAARKDSRGEYTRPELAAMNAPIEARAGPNQSYKREDVRWCNTVPRSVPLVPWAMGDGHLASFSLYRQTLAPTLHEYNMHLPSSAHRDAIGSALRPTFPEWFRGRRCELRDRLLSL